DEKTCCDIKLILASYGFHDGILPKIGLKVLPDLSHRVRLTQRDRKASTSRELHTIIKSMKKGADTQNREHGRNHISGFTHSHKVKIGLIEHSTGNGGEILVVLAPTEIHFLDQPGNQDSTEQRDGNTQNLRSGKTKY